MSLILPKRGNRQQPRTTASRVDRSNALARGIDTIWLPGRPGMVAVGSAMTNVVNRSGRAVTSANTANNRIEMPTAVAGSAGDFTIVFHGFVPAAPFMLANFSNTANPSPPNYNPTSGYVWWTEGLYGNPNGFVCGMSLNNGVDYPEQLFALARPTGPCTAAYAFVNNSVLRFALDGYVEERTYNVTRQAENCNSISIGSTNQDINGQGQYNTTIVYNRALSLAELRSITRNPWQVMTGPRSRSVAVLMDTAGGPSAITATAAVTGSGSANAAGSAGISASAGVSGGGSAAAVASTLIAAAAAVTGGGSLSASGAARINAAGTVTGTGAISSVASLPVAALVAVTGAGSASGSGAARISAAGNISGSGGISANAALPIAATAGVSGAGSVAATGIVAAAGSINAVVSVTGGGSISAAAAGRIAGAASLIGGGSAMSAGAVRAQAAAGVSGSGGVGVVVAVSVQAAVTISGAGAVTADGAMPVRMSGAVSGRGVVNAAAVAMPMGELVIDPSRVFFARLPPSLFPAADPPRRFAAAEPPRYFEARLAMTPHHTIKDPDPTVTAVLTVDFASVLPGGATLTAHAVTASGGSIVNSSIDGTRVLAELSGGTLGDTVEVKFIATPNTGPKRISTVAVRIATIYAQQPIT